MRKPSDVGQKGIMSDNTCCKNPLNDYWARNCTNKEAHTSQPEHADHRGWSCYICNGPCGQPTDDLPRCGHSHPDYIGVWCMLHRGHKRQHGFTVRWGDGWDK
jgi:hypothetical protein